MTTTPDLATLCRLAATMLGAVQVSPDDLLVEDLGAESIDLVNIVAEVEDRYHVTVDEERLGVLRTIRDLHDILGESA